MADAKKKTPPDSECPICHGDPKNMAGGHVGQGNPETGEVTCPGCGGVSGRRKKEP